MYAPLALAIPAVPIPAVRRVARGLDLPDLASLILHDTAHLMPRAQCGIKRGREPSSPARDLSYLTGPTNLSAARWAGYIEHRRLAWLRHDAYLQSKRPPSMLAVYVLPVSGLYSVTVMPFP